MELVPKSISGAYHKVYISTNILKFYKKILLLKMVFEKVSRILILGPILNMTTYWHIIHAGPQAGAGFSYRYSL